MATEPARAAGAFEAIAATGRQALVEMRRLLGVLRATATRPQPRPPQPGLAQVPSLVEQVGRAGLRVELVVEGAEEPLPPGIDLSAYRIVQEAPDQCRQARRLWPGPGGPLRRGDLGCRSTNEARPAGLGAAWSATAAAPLRQLARRRPAGPVGAGRHARAGAPVRGELPAGLGPGGGFTVDARLPSGPGRERAAHQGPGGRRPGWSGPGSG